MNETPNTTSTELPETVRIWTCQSVSKMVPSTDVTDVEVADDGFVTGTWNGLDVTVEV